MYVRYVYVFIYAFYKICLFTKRFDFIFFLNLFFKASNLYRLLLHRIDKSVREKYMYACVYSFIIFMHLN